MANRPALGSLGLQTQNIPQITEEQLSATASPARGRDMKMALLKNLRAPPLIHIWEFWHERQDRKPAAPNAPATTTAPAEEKSYKEKLVKLATVSDIKEFWQVFNNFDVTTLPRSDAVHLFHKDTEPVWEHRRNWKGGALSFRVTKEKAPGFWKEMCMLAIGEKLQPAVESTTYKNDICGIGYSVKWNDVVISVWIREAQHAEAVDKLKQIIVDNIPAELHPRNGFGPNEMFFKRHEDHKGFKKPEGEQ